MDLIMWQSKSKPRRIPLHVKDQYRSQYQPESSFESHLSSEAGK